eukprot:snap_masked-scaffold_28-processed-gene-3.69-mRNA-1 protein AED:1.00 eAED:1.00 QI:0/0/0/0/1/1/2/0/362
MAKKGKGSSRVTRAGTALAPSSDEDPPLKLGGGNPKDRTSSVDTAEGENEFLPSSDQPTQIASVGKDKPQEGGKIKIKKKLLPLRVKLKNPSAKLKRKATSKAAKSVAKKAKPAKAKPINLVGESNSSPNLQEVIPDYYRAKNAPSSLNPRETQAIVAETTSDSSGDDDIEEIDIIDQTIENQDELVGELGYEQDLDALSDDDKRDLAYRKYKLKKGQALRKRGTSEESLNYDEGAGVAPIGRSATSVRNAVSNDDLYKEVTRKLNDPTSGNAAGSLVEKKTVERDLKEFDSLNPQEKRIAFAKLIVQHERARIQNNATLAALKSKGAENQTMGKYTHVEWPEKVGGENWIWKRLVLRLTWT